MGFRLEISKIKYVTSGSKMYGYVEDETLENLKSYQWLLKHGYIDGDEYWDYGCDVQIILRPDQFKEFITLYNEDFNEYKSGDCWAYEKDYIINQKEVQELINGKDKILLEWW